MPAMHEDVLTRFTVGPTGSADRDSAELHVAYCVPCRRELASRELERGLVWNPVPASLVERLRTAGAPARPKASGRSVWRWIAVAVLAVLAVALVLTRTRVQGPRVAAARVTPAALDEPAVALSAPADGAEVAPDGLELRWERFPGAVRYSVGVLDEEGTILFEGESASTAIRIEALPATPGRRCYWYVIAKGADGRAVKSRLQSVLVATP